MKILIVTHKDINYEFRLLEQSNIVEITKGNLLTYIMRRSGYLFSCSCPGAKYHGKCWHRGMLKFLRKQKSINEPWAEWAEEVGIENYEK
jgi:hypothetical protein